MIPLKKFFNNNPNQEDKIYAERIKKIEET